MPNQGKIQQEDGHAFSTTDTKIRYRTENSGSPLEHAQVDSNFEVLRRVANGLVDDIKSNYDDIKINQASIASLENRMAEVENVNDTQANDIAVNGVKIGDNLEKIEALQELTASQGEDITSNADGIATNATAILNLDTKTTDNHTALETRVTNNETAIETLQTSDATNTQNITELQNGLEVTTAGAIANENNINTLDTRTVELGELLEKTINDLQTFFGESDLDLETIETSLSNDYSRLNGIDGRLDGIDGQLTRLFTTTDNSNGLTIPSITSALDQAALAVVSNDADIAALKERANALEASVSSVQSDVTNVQSDVTTVQNTASTPGFFSGNYEVNSGTGAKNTTVNMSSYNVPAGAKWGVFWTYNAGNDWPNHRTYVFPNSSFTNGAMVFYNHSDKSQYGGVQFLAPIVGGKCYIKSQEDSTDSWKLYLHGWI